MKMSKKLLKSKKSMASKDYSGLDKNELIKVIEKLESRKKYGLIWDEEKVKEQFEKDAENAFPVLKEITSKEIIDKDASKPTNILIEGDNYHALSVLNFTHQGKIDVIYIDPPYNTGTKDWKYSNDYVDINDEFRHSKWLSFMAKRLRLAKNLLKVDSGVLICTIDDNEHAALGLLLQELFPNYEIVGVVIVHNPAGVQGKNFSYTHEIAYFVYPKNSKCIGTTARDKDLISPLRDWGGTSARKLAKTCFYPVIIKDEKILGFGEVCAEAFHPKSANVLQKDGSIYIYPIDGHGIERKWVYSRSSAEKNIDQLSVKKIDNEYVIIRRKSAFTYRTVWDDKKYYANIFGSKLLNDIVPDNFPFPKSLYAVEDCIKAVIHDKDDAVILDFFAGSGTTGHAVLELNKQDDGDRQFILCTNNENNIATDICYPRIEKIIRGYKSQKGQKVEGLGGSLKYFKTKFVKTNSNSDDFKTRITNECTEMLCLREGVFNEIKKTTNYRIFQQGDKTLAVYYSLKRDNLPALKKELEKIEGEKTLYCFTLDPIGLSRTEFAGWHGVTLEPIPQKILDVYKQIYEY
ncbi:MAG: site-specific DNA-methyltransferase [Candidatus Paceibacterota bacterium]